MNKERVTVNLDGAVLKRIDRLVDGRSLRNRSHAVESLVLKGLEREGIKTAFILAGGAEARPKAMVEVKGRPILSYIIELLRKFEVRNVIVSVGRGAEEIKTYFGNGDRFGVRISYVEEKEPLGTAGALKLAKSLLLERFFVFNGDNLTNINLSDMLSFHLNSNAAATIALTTARQPEEYGVVEMQGNKVVDFAEKPRHGESSLINSGAYIFEPSVLEEIPKGTAKLEKDLFPRLVEEGKLFGYLYAGQWFDAGKEKDKERAEKDWKGII